jgi:Fe-S-cluster containining protein
VTNTRLFKDNKEKSIYVAKVLERIESQYLHVYPFLTDEEFLNLMGDKVMNAISALNCPGEICGLCDVDIDCPFYSRRLDVCGIGMYKPVHCRLWHCYQCGPKEVVDQLRELTSLLADQLSLKTDAQEIKDALERDDITVEEARRRFIRLVEEYRRG